MNTACLSCRTSNPNLLDKPTGRLYCVKCGAEIAISDAIRNVLAKKAMFMSAAPAPSRTPAFSATPPVRMPPPPNWAPTAPAPPAWQSWNPNAAPTEQAPRPRPQYERPVARPAESNQQAALQAAQARVAKMAKVAGIRSDQSTFGQEELREGVVQFSERTPEEAAEYRAYVKESLESFDGGISPTRYLPKTDFVRDEFSRLGISVDELDSGIKRTVD